MELQRTDDMINLSSTSVLHHVAVASAVSMELRRTDEWDKSNSSVCHHVVDHHHHGPASPTYPKSFSSIRFGPAHTTSNIWGAFIIPPPPPANLSAISYPKSSCHFKPQIFPPFRTTNLPAAARSSSTLHPPPRYLHTYLLSSII